MNHISKALRGVADKYNGVSLIIRIIVGLIAGTALALVVPHMTWIGEFGTLFVSALKAVAPILVFVLVASALAQGNSKLDGVSARCFSCICSPRSCPPSWRC